MKRTGKEEGGEGRIMGRKRGEGREDEMKGKGRGRKVSERLEKISKI